MKKKFIAALFISTLMLSGCGAPKVPADSNTHDSETMQTDDTAAQGDISDLDALGDIEVDKNLLTVEFTIPADFVGETTQEELDQTAAEEGYNSITLNDDGSATYVMTKAKHKEMMEEMTDSIRSSLDDLVGSTDYPSFTDITTNDDFTKFTITTTSTELDLSESFSVMAFYMYGGMYNLFNGTPVDNVHVDFINADSGEIISSSDSSTTAE